MSVEENKAIARRLIEGWQNPATIDECIAADIAVYPGTFRGRDAYKQACANYLVGIPDVRVVVEDIVAEGDRVVVRYSASGTHTGEWHGAPPTGKPVSYGGMYAFRLAGGKIVEQWQYADDMEFWRQLGLDVPTFSELVEQAQNKQV